MVAIGGTLYCHDKYLVATGGLSIATHIVWLLQVEPSIATLNVWLL
jgi:hypothetical protein